MHREEARPMRMKTKNAVRCAGRWIQRFLDVRFPVDVPCGRRTQ
jgi:hypothetical protein